MGPLFAVRGGRSGPIAVKRLSDQSLRPGRDSLQVPSQKQKKWRTRVRH